MENILKNRKIGLKYVVPEGETFRFFDNNERAKEFYYKEMCSVCKTTASSKTTASNSCLPMTKYGICEHCGSILINSNRIKKNNNLKASADKENMYYIENKEDIYIAIEFSQYCFVIANITINVKTKHRLSNNKIFLPKEERPSFINRYSSDLCTYKYISELNDVNSDIKMNHYFLYDINRKPGKRKLLNIDGVDYYDYKQKTIRELFPENVQSLVEIDRHKNYQTDFLRAMKRSNKLLSTIILEFEEPNLLEELAIKHDMDKDSIVIKNPKATKLHEVMGISKAYLKHVNEKYEEFIKKNLFYSVTKKELIELYYSIGDDYKSFFKMVEEIASIDGLGTKTIRHYKMFYKFNYDVKRLKEYLTDIYWQQGLNSHKAFSALYDILNMYNELNITDFDKYPKSLIKTHDILVMRYNSIKAEIESDSFKEVAKEYSKLKYSDKKYIIKPVKEAKELLLEGQSLNHCVGSYASRITSKNSMVFFMRLKEDDEKSLITVETTPLPEMKIIQKKGSFNRTPTPEENAFLLKWKKSKLDKTYYKTFDNSYIDSEEILIAD